MKYGTAFVGPDGPTLDKSGHKFRRARRLHGEGWRARALLQGVCNTGEELAAMLNQADNGKRSFFCPFDKKRGLYGIYVYYPEPWPEATTCGSSS